MYGDFDATQVVLSFGISFLGAYIAICGCEQLRGIYLKDSSPSAGQVVPWFLLIGSALGGVGIWSMHFIGMSAMSLQDSNGNDVNIEFNIGVSVFSMIAAVIAVCGGVAIASHDRVFAKSKAEIVEIFSADLKHLTLTELRNISSFQLLTLACTKELHYLIVGGVVAAGGIGIMHYVGMAAMEFHGRIVWNIGIIAASVVMAALASIAAFWILFRLLSIYPDIESLRLAAALVMGIAVCGTHYVGMLAANFKVDETKKEFTKLAWRTSTMKNTDSLYPVVVAALITLWVFTMIIFHDLRWKVTRYRQYVSKISGSKQKTTEILSMVESVHTTAKNSRISNSSVAPLPSGSRPASENNSLAV